MTRKQNKTFSGPGYKGYVLNMTSQQWLDTSIVDRRFVSCVDFSITISSCSVVSACSLRHCHNSPVCGSTMLWLSCPTSCTTSRRAFSTSPAAAMTTRCLSVTARTSCCALPWRWPTMPPAPSCTKYVVFVLFLVCFQPSCINALPPPVHHLSSLTTHRCRTSQSTSLPSSRRADALRTPSLRTRGTTS